ncbi:MAG: site-2 protease family protein [Clostridium sp.]|nr:site-2 protease family protein [Clostridium sp.]MDU7082063.1 site-2 protease family protein [Clostridium sp.]
MNDFLLNIVLVIPAILIAFTAKGWVQAKIAIKLGDNTPKAYGRDTFNPIHHIDIVGFIFMLIFRFGWTKPMQIDRRNFKNYFKDDLKVRVAGVAANLVVGFIATIAWVAFGMFAKGTNINIVIYNIILNIAVLNCTWFVLNLLPIPGFDGFNIIIDVLKNKSIKYTDFMQRYNLLIFLVLIMPLIGNSSILEIVVGVPGKMIFGFFCNIGLMIF